MNPKRLLALVTLAACTGVLSLGAHSSHGWRRGDHHHDGRRGWGRGATVTFYEHADFRGASLTLEIGQHIPDLDYARFDNGARINDRISSIRIDGPVEVTAFEHRDFDGRALVFGRDVRNLAWIEGRWNDVISSLSVRPRQGR